MVLVASILSSPCFHLAFVIATRSAGVGAPGVTVIVAVRVTPNHDAVMVTVVVTLTNEVDTANVPLEAPPLTTTSVGTCTTAALLLDSWTDAPLVAPVKVTVPVAALPPVRLDGVTDTPDSDGPGGVAVLTDTFAVRGTFCTAAVIWTIVGGAAALVVIVKVTVPWPAGATIDAGTVATDGSLLKSRTVVGAASGISVTVPSADAPLRIIDGETESAEMIPWAEALVGRATTAPIANAISMTRRRMGRSRVLARRRDVCVPSSGR